MVQNHYRCRCLPLPYFSHCYDECDTSSSRRLHKQSVSNIAEYCCNIAKRVSCKEFGKKLARDYPQDCCCKNLVKKNACSCKATSNILRKKVAQESCSWKAGLSFFIMISLYVLCHVYKDFTAGIKLECFITAVFIYRYTLYKLVLNSGS